MTGYERLEKSLTASRGVAIMGHVVGGYPDIDTCEKTVLAMAEAGCSIVEVQLPFSDPSADGPVIVAANHYALTAGIKTTDVIAMMKRIREKTDMALIVMSYLNPILAYGIERLAGEMVESGIDGFIIPDLPPEEDRILGISALCEKNGIALVPLIAPASTDERIREICESFKSPFVYAVLRLGVTGRKTELDAETSAYIDRVAKVAGRDVAAGFGISERAQITMLAGHARCGIVGSAIVRTINTALENGEDIPASAGRFIGELRGK